MQKLLSKMTLGTDMNDVISSYSGPMNCDNVSCETAQINDISCNDILASNIQANVLMTAKSFVTNYTERPQYANSIPYAASVVAGKKNDLSNCNLNTSIVYGESNVISGENKPSVGNMFVGGMKNIAIGNSTGATVIGGLNILSAASNYTTVFGQQNKVKAENSFIAGVDNIVSDKTKKAFVMGWSNKVDVASGTDGTVIVLGKNATASHNGSFIWNGAASNGATTIYETHGTGTFNVNPINGISGFYIGNMNFVDAVLSAVSLMTIELKNTLRDLLNLA